ncbi:hypothetical protein MGYG_02668 [Nannizzia gypsea CBS 118893]|uniref:Uncharacterized protein n=1 Tax=Arthroderma gypseum (strain ATCC MYA-4604 / CBS 118893) TaxID=535722 RepID=E4UNQ2_ARTGP|nr:hypothetical protein MGYG_02668 [Nannizzia gypsea CBS 118893]EFQ99655.1 hypothetical protein MGYG_02668 [Nannizzia gypsea CBS 118893]
MQQVSPFLSSGWRWIPNIGLFSRRNSLWHDTLLARGNIVKKLSPCIGHHPKDAFKSAVRVDARPSSTGRRGTLRAKNHPIATLDHQAVPAFFSPIRAEPPRDPPRRERGMFLESIVRLNSGQRALLSQVRQQAQIRERRFTDTSKGGTAVVQRTEYGVRDYEINAV